MIYPDIKKLILPRFHWTNICITIQVYSMIVEEHCKQNYVLPLKQQLTILARTWKRRLSAFFFLV